MIGFSSRRMIISCSLVRGMYDAIPECWLILVLLEPCMLLMERSAERYPYITAIMMEFLKYAVDEYYPPLKDYMEKCVECGMRVMLEKGVIRQVLLCDGLCGY